MTQQCAILLIQQRYPEAVVERRADGWQVLDSPRSWQGGLGADAGFTCKGIGPRSLNLKAAVIAGAESLAA